jgi:putative transposase
MARLPRLNLADVPQHVIQRGNNRQATFFADEDYATYLDKLREYADKYQVAVHAFVLMTNHVHLLMTPSTDTGVSQLMQSLGRYYVRYINHTYRRSGTLWEGRYKSTLVDEEAYLLTVSRYIELNPVRAQMVSRPRDYPWSSYHRNALGKDIKLVTPHPVYTALGGDDAARRKAYQALFRRQIPSPVLYAIRQSTNRGWVLGDDRFKAEVEEMAGRRATPKPKGGDRKSKAYLESARNG